MSGDKHDESAPEAAVRYYGGVAKEPTIEKIETRTYEVIEPAMLRPDAPHMFWQPRYVAPPWDFRANVPGDSLALSVDRFYTAERRQWATTLWIPESEMYNPVRNVLTIRGHYRTYLFDVWVKEGAPLQPVDTSIAGGE